jgi:eukaryotic-like serine/threonine-protein kinase
MAINRPPVLVPGTNVRDRYAVISVVGQGGLGTVYQVRDVKNNSVYALKETFDLSEGAREQFTREANWLARLDHPNIPKVRDFFEWQSRLYLTMDFITGDNLEHKLIRSGRRALAEADVWRWIAPICDALNHMHMQHPPIIHRDVKPANIIVTPEGRPYLVDLGIAKEHVQGLPNLTATFVRKAGTEGYAPPEQYTSQGKTGPWSDIYSLGATLYHLLTGHIPASPIDRAALDGQLVPPRKLNPGISTVAEALIVRALALRPNDRYASMQDMYNAVIKAAQMLNGQTPSPAAQSSSPQISGSLISGSLPPNRPAVSKPSWPQNPGSPQGGVQNTPPRPISVPNLMAQSNPPASPQLPLQGQSAPQRGKRQAKPIERRRGAANIPPPPPPPGSAGTPSSPKLARQMTNSKPNMMGTSEHRAAVAAPLQPWLQKIPWQIIASVVVIALVGFGLLIGTHLIPFGGGIDRSTPQSVVTSYYNALQNHDYGTAYQCFSQNATGTISSDQFTQRMQTKFNATGDISSFAITATNAQGDMTLVTVNINYKNASQESVNVTVIAINSAWYINSVP